MRLESFVADWGEPVREIVVVAHSMGGLVMRSACQVAEREKLAWRGKLRQIVFLGTPHHGAPLERGGNWVTLALDASSYTAAFARLGRIRSAGITDLRFGQVTALREGDRFAPGSGHRETVPLPRGVACYRDRCDPRQRSPGGGRCRRNGSRQGRPRRRSRAVGERAR